MWPSKSVFQALTPSSLLQGVPALCPLRSSLRIPKSCPGLFPRILAGLTPAGLFGLHPLPRLHWGRWWLPNGGGVRQGSPSWFLLNLCCLLFPVPVARSPGLSLCCGSLSCPPYPPPCLLLKKGKWVSWAGSSPGALKLPVLSPTQVHPLHQQPRQRLPPKSQGLGAWRSSPRGSPPTSFLLVLQG